MIKQYKYWQVSENDIETDGLLSITSIWSDEWHSIRKMSEVRINDLRDILKEDIELYETINFKKVDKRKISPALLEFQKIIKEYKNFYKKGSDFDGK